MDSKAAAELAHYLNESETVLSQRVATHLLDRHPEIRTSLRLEEDYEAIERLAEVSVERLNRLVRAMLLFEAPTLAEPELRWARDVLVRWGVTRQHTTALIDLYFADIDQRELDPAVTKLARHLHHFLLTQLDQLTPPAVN